MTESVVYLLKTVHIEHDGCDLVFLFLFKLLHDLIKLISVIYTRELIKIEALILKINYYAGIGDRKTYRLNRYPVENSLQSDTDSYRKNKFPYREIS